MHRIGIDLGGTKIEGVVLAADGTIVERRRVATERERGYDHILDRVAALVRELRPSRRDIGRSASARRARRRAPA